MSGSRTVRQRFWSGALLLAVQLVGAAALPLAHLGFEPDGLDHIEAPGSHPGGHNDAACHVCRHADARFLPGTGAGGPERAVAQPRTAGLTAAAPRLAVRLDLATAPRGPPPAA